MSLADELATTATFAGFSRPELEVLASAMRELRIGPGETIVEQGERARAAYVVLEGELSVERRAPGSGNRVTIAVRRRGQLFGMLSLLDGGPRMATCRAMTPVRLAELAGDDFGRLLAANSPIGTRFQHAVATALIRELRITNLRITEMATFPEIDDDALLITLGPWE